MSNDKYAKPTFSLSLLHPRNWGVWLGFGCLAIIVNILPYSLLYRFGRFIGHIGMKYGKSRVHITQRNLELAFFWPTWRFKRIIIDKDTQLLRQYTAEKQGVLLCCVHALNLEITARALQLHPILGPHPQW